MAGKELDLRRLHDLVQQLGGYVRVWADKKWTHVAAGLGISKEACPNGPYLCRCAPGPSQSVVMLMRQRACLLVHLVLRTCVYERERERQRERGR